MAVLGQTSSSLGLLFAPHGGKHRDFVPAGQMTQAVKGSHPGTVARRKRKTVSDEKDAHASSFPMVSRATMKSRSARDNKRRVNRVLAE